MAGFHHRGVQAAGAQQVQAVAEGAGDAFLAGAQQVAAGMRVQVEAEQMGAHLLVFQHPLGAVAEGQTQQAGGPNGRRGGEGIQLSVAQFRPDEAAQPAIEAAHTVNAQQHAQAGCLRAVINVGEGIDARLLIHEKLVSDGVDDARRAGRRGDFARLQHVEGQGIIGLVAGFVGDGNAGGQAQLGGYVGAQAAMHGEHLVHGREQIFTEAKKAEHIFGKLVFDEVPEDAF